jgi:ABC-type uncharacterized transport system substrate-binding protein
MPGLTRAMFVANPKTTTYRYYLAEAEAAARAQALELVPAAIESVSDLQSSIAAFAREPGGALIVVPDLTSPRRRGDRMRMYGATSPRSV